MIDMQELQAEIALLKDRKMYDEALLKCNQPTKNNCEKLLLARERADIFHLMGDIYRSLQCAIEMEKLGSQEPSDYYDLTRRGLELGENKNAVAWADIGLALCEDHNQSYYRQSLNFHKACALINMMQYPEALRALDLVENGYSVYMPNKGVIKKDQLVRACEENRKKEKKIYKFD